MFGSGECSLVNQNATLASFPGPTQLFVACSSGTRLMPPHSGTNLDSLVPRLSPLKNGFEARALDQG